MTASIRPRPRPKRSRPPSGDVETPRRRAPDRAARRRRPASRRRWRASCAEIGMGEGEFVVELRRAGSGPDRRRRGRVPRPPEPRPAASLLLPRPPRAASCLASRSRSPRSPAATTMVFDEIDAGIGGETAHRVAETLRRLAERAQVDHDHAPPADRERRRPALPRREDRGRPDAHSHQAARRGRAARRAAADARRAGVPLERFADELHRADRAREARPAHEEPRPAPVGRRHRDHRPHAISTASRRRSSSSRACASW